MNFCDFIAPLFLTSTDSLFSSYAPTAWLHSRYRYFPGYAPLVIWYLESPVYLLEQGVYHGYAVPLFLLECIVHRCDNLCTSFEIGGLFRFHSRFQVRIFEACLQFEGGRSDDSRGKVPLFDTLPLWLR